MTSLRKQASNQINAQKSTGPVSAAGKRKAAQNALRHGLSSKAPTAAHSAAVRNLAGAFRADDPDLPAGLALRLAESFTRAGEISWVMDGLVEQSLREQDAKLRHEQREDLGALAAMDRLRPLNNLQARAAGTLRRALGKA